jgi:ADP-ribose pyrophosphatase
MSIPAHADVVVESEQQAWSGRFPIELVRFRHRRFDGAMSATRTWELWRRGPAAAVVPYDPVRDVVVLIEQFRLPALAAGLEPVLTEPPAGLCDAGESAEATARREMHEEMGLSVADLMKIGDFLLTPGGSDELCTLFVGRVQAPAANAEGIAGLWGLAAEQEDIRVRVWPAASAIDAALSGRLPNPVLTIGLLWLAARRDWLRQQWRLP